MSVGADRVKCASRCAMKDYAPTPNCAAQSYMFRCQSPLDNTFINLCVQDQHLMRRCRSVPCIVSAEVEAPSLVANPYKLNPGGISVAANPKKTVAVLDLEARHGNGLEVQEAPSDFTTVVMRNLPVHTDKAGVRVALQDTGFHRAYDYLYVPA
eukprot:4864521-Amphidinium_carterae.2